MRCTAVLVIKKLSDGRLGNRLFHYNFLKQVSFKTNIKCGHIKMPENIYFKDMDKAYLNSVSFNRKIKISSKEILNYSSDEFLSFVENETLKGRDIIIQPPILGEVFFDYLFYSPNKFIQIRDEYKLDFPFQYKDKTVIGIHFRGGDFPAWNINAALKFPYYKEAIAFCAENFKEPIFVLFTDDEKYPAYIETKEWIKKEFPQSSFIGNPKELPIYDFYQMTQCNVLISSPSTFAIFAGCLGNAKKIIHCKDWIDYSIDRKDKFWVDLVNKKHEYYNIYKMF